MSLLHVRVFKNGDPADGVSSASFLFGASLPICQLFNFTYAFSRESRSRVVCISQYLFAHTNIIGETSSSNVVLNRFVTETVDLESRTRSRSTCGAFFIHVHFLYCRTPFLDPRTIYAHLAIFVVTGVAMGFDIGRRRAAVVHAGQLLHLVFLLLTTERVEYRNWVKVSH